MDYDIQNLIFFMWVALFIHTIKLIPQVRRIQFPWSSSDRAESTSIRFRVSSQRASNPSENVVGFSFSECCRASVGRACTACHYMRNFQVHTARKQGASHLVSKSEHRTEGVGPSLEVKWGTTLVMYASPLGAAAVPQVDSNLMLCYRGSQQQDLAILTAWEF